MEVDFKQGNKLLEKSPRFSNNKNDIFTITKGSEFNKNHKKNEKIFTNDSVLTNEEMNKENNYSLNESNKSNKSNCHYKLIIDKHIFNQNEADEADEQDENISLNQNNQNSNLNFYNFHSQKNQKNQLNIKISLDDLSISQINNDNQNQSKGKNGKNFFENYLNSDNSNHKLVKEDEKMNDSVNDKIDNIEEEEEEEDDYDDDSDSTYKNYKNYNYYKNNMKKKKHQRHLKKIKNKHLKDNINNNKKEKFNNKSHIIKIELSNNHKKNNNNYKSIIKNNNLNSNININNLKNELNNFDNNKNFENNNYNFINNNSSNIYNDELKEKSITNKNDNIINYQIHLDNIKSNLLTHNSNNNNNVNEIYQNELSNYLHNEINEMLSNTKSEDTTINNSNTYINCDLRYFNFDLITERIGSFDVVLIDPPWRIKGGQRNNDKFMFSNSKFQLDYNTLSNNDIISLKIETLSTKGFIFLWVLNSLLDVGINCLEKWGYSLVDELKWLKTKNDKVCTSQGFYFLHSTEICLVGYKCRKNDHMDFISKVWTDIIISDIQEKSKKPEKLYEIIEHMLPGSKKIELFARNHNLRKGWLSLGNELGMGYIKKNNDKFYYCSCCHLEISKGKKRYKSKIIGNCNLCDKCFKSIYFNNSNNNDNTNYLENSIYDLENQRRKNISCVNSITNSKLLDEFQRYYPNHNSEKNFFVLNNDITDEIRHKNIQCNSCKIEPINGLRFKCNDCLLFNLCEECFDNYLNLQVNDNDGNKNIIDVENNKHNTSHSFRCLEIDELNDPSLAVHLTCRCKNCYMKPIIGVCFQCADCKFCLCQNCYFNLSYKDYEHFGNNPKHKIAILNKAKNVTKNKYIKCKGCPNSKIIEHVRYKCDNCFNFDLCENCYANRYNINFTGTAHKNYHTFSCYYLE